MRLRDAGDGVVLGLDRGLERGVVHRGAERHDGVWLTAASVTSGSASSAFFTVASQ